jgi:hypothetical protein
MPCHSLLASALGVRQLVVAVNKMDTAGYDEAAFRYGRLMQYQIPTTGTSAAAASTPQLSLPLSSYAGPCACREVEAEVRKVLRKAQFPPTTTVGADQGGCYKPLPIFLI